jgi:hypothetical protein
MAAARTRLILDKPFLGALALRLPLLEADGDWCQSTWSNGKSLYYSRTYMREALHCALLHFYRRGHRVQRLWDSACDFAVNPLLIDDGLKPTPDTVFMPDFKGMTAEEIYPLLQDNELQQDPSGGEDSEQDSASRQAERNLDQGEKERLAAQWRQRLASAAQQALQAGKLCPGAACWRSI